MGLFRGNLLSPVAFACCFCLSKAFPLPDAKTGAETRRSRSRLCFRYKGKDSSLNHQCIEWR